MKNLTKRASAARALEQIFSKNVYQPIQVTLTRGFGASFHNASLSSNSSFSCLKMLDHFRTLPAHFRTPGPKVVIEE